MENKPLKSFLELIKDSCKIFFSRQNFGFLLKTTFLTLLSQLAAVVIVLTLFGLIYGLLNYFNIGNFVVISLLVILVVLSSIAILGWGQMVMYQALKQAINGKYETFKELMRAAWNKRAIGLVLLQLLIMLLVGLGFILLVIPGIVLMVWLMFSAFIYIYEKANITTSLNDGKKLVEGYFWSVLGYNLLYGIFMMIINGLVNAVVPLAGSIVSILFSYYFGLFPVLLYRDLKRVKG